MLAAALVLTPPGHATAGRRLRCTVLPGAAAQAGVAAAAWQALLAGNAMAPCLPLFATLARAGGAQLDLGLSGGSHLHVDVAAGT
jgi:ferric-dicitrate binding protein FerR (iron transport regulator)